MSVPLVINGVTYNYPVQFDTNWGPTLTAWSTAVTLGMLQKAGGSFPLTAEVDFGNSFGIRTKYLRSEETTVASTGIIRLASQSDGIAFRNTLDSADLILTTDASNMLTFNGVQLGPLTSLLHNHIYVGDSLNQPSDVPMTGDITIADTGVTTISNSAVNNSKISAFAAIDRTKMALTTPYVILANASDGTMSENSPLDPDLVVISDSLGLLTTSVTTSTELSYVSGATSNLQSQINSIAAGATIQAGTVLDFAGTVAPSGYLVCDGSSLLRASYPDLFTAIGTTWGAADGSHFNIPALSRRTTVGSGGSGSGTLGNTVGSTGGAEDVTSTQAAHNHTQDAHQHAQTWGHLSSTSYTDATSPYGTVSVNHTFFTAATAGSGPSALNYDLTSSVTATNQATTATNNASSVIQPSAVMLKIIKT